jgi:hypothetical protein
MNTPASPPPDAPDPGDSATAPDPFRDASDPFLEEVRAMKRAVSERFGNDIDKLCDYLQELQKEYADRIVRAPAPDAPDADSRKPAA